MVTTIRHTLPAWTAPIRNAATTVSDIDSGNHVPRGDHTRKRNGPGGATNTEPGTSPTQEVGYEQQYIINVG